MFKKLKDKLAEEVKSSPQRIQQFAQAAQAAVTSASSSISDITNSDLFSIGDNDTQQSRAIRTSSPGGHKNSNPTFQDVSLTQSGSLQTSMDSMDFTSAQDLSDNQRQRKLSNSSFASDVSFRLPNYESPSMYHLQSDMEVSASEAEERGFSSGNVSLDRVTKEQIYAAYRRTQERYTKYRTQYADLARHYKLLERENAKAKSVLVETQDKALRRISELREQCSLEQSAKAHLEKALRFDLEEKNLKIEALNTKIKLLQNDNVEQDGKEKKTDDANVRLISFENENNHTGDETPSSENLNNKIEKLEKLLTKYKDSLKNTKEKNAQLTTEIQIISSEIQTKDKEIDDLKANVQRLNETEHKIQKLNDLNEELQNKIKLYEFNKNKEQTILELDLQKAQEKIAQLQSKIQVFSKREEEYAISLAENKLSIHKELENKEAEIKSLKYHLAESKQEIQSLDIVLNDYKNNAAKLEVECSKLKNEIIDLNHTKSRVTELESQIQLLTQRCQSLENIKIKAEEEYKCLQLQLKQETAEKLAMIDRNSYLENRNTQLTEENKKKSSEIHVLEKELQIIQKENTVASSEDIIDKTKLIEDIDMWKSKCSVLESEIQEERVELGKLQSEIEKLLANAELIQIQNSELNTQIDTIKTENKSLLKEKQSSLRRFKSVYKNINLQINDLKRLISLTTQETMSLKQSNKSDVTKIKENLDSCLRQFILFHNQTTDQDQIHKTEIQRMSIQLNLMKDENIKLKSELNGYDLSKKEFDQTVQQIKKEYHQTIENLNSSQSEKKKIEDELKEFQIKCQELQNSIDHNICERDTLKQKIASMINNDVEIQDLCKQLEESKAKCELLEITVNQNNNELLTLNQNISDMSEKIKNYDHNIEIIQSDKQNLAKALEEANAKSEILQDIINRNNNCQTNLKEKINNFEHTINTLQSEKQKIAEELDESNAKCETLQNIINRNNKDHISIKQSLNKLELENSSLIEEIRHLKNDNGELMEKLKHYEENHANNEKMLRKINDLTQENLSLRNQSAEYTIRIKDLEIELRDVKKSHAETEIEKSRLNSIIGQLETTEKECFAKDTQTDNVSQNNDVVENTLQRENEALKEDNKRLTSDVTGLQTYLAKISKENSVLNDKLRELIASSENSQNNSLITIELKDEEVQLRKEKLDDLIRENNLLSEENLELKDQLNSQHYAKHELDKSHEIGKENELLTLKEKYASILDINERLEKRVLDLDQINKSVNGNMSHLQQNNEKLRLINEKLERRLDEALVSLRHLHALQENTELEYLRNILYEYLTGTGAHSVTLAKVLAAVVKFDKTQTEQVLQKEKERQGFLRQLGLL